MAQGRPRNCRKLPGALSGCKLTVVWAVVGTDALKTWRYCCAPWRGGNWCLSHHTFLYKGAVGEPGTREPWLPLRETEAAALRGVGWGERVVVAAGKAVLVLAAGSEVEAVRSSPATRGGEAARKGLEGGSSPLSPRPPHRLRAYRRACALEIWGGIYWTGKLSSSLRSNSCISTTDTRHRPVVVQFKGQPGRLSVCALFWLGFYISL